MTDQLPPRPWRIRKTTFSRSPWRLVDATGRWLPLGHVPSDLPGGPPTEPIVGAETKAACVDLVCDALSTLYESVAAP